MTGEERIRAAVNLEIPDRVSIAPLIGQFPCAGIWCSVVHIGLPY